MTLESAMNATMNATTLEEMTAYLARVNRKLDDIDGHVTELWEDGEITVTKCNRGELYGQRGVHIIEAGNPAQTLPLTVFPVQFRSGHACVRLASVEEARQVRDALCWPEPV